MLHSEFLRFGALAAVAPRGSGLARAETYPTGPVRLVVGIPLQAATTSSPG
jgi:hypothetical protein